MRQCGFGIGVSIKLISIIKMSIKSLWRWWWKWISGCKITELLWRTWKGIYGKCLCMILLTLAHIWVLKLPRLLMALNLSFQFSLIIKRCLSQLIPAVISFSRPTYLPLISPLIMLMTFGIKISLHSHQIHLHSSARNRAHKKKFLKQNARGKFANENFIVSFVFWIN